MSQEFKDYVVFKKGSYWIYKLEGTTRTDTNTLTLAEIKIVKDSREVDYNYEDFFMHIKRSFRNDTLIIFSGAKFKGTHGINYYEEINSSADVHYFDGNL